ncbi:MAG: hypothetical protein PHO67_08430 [Candidatus Omnitrophica bacterium]|nr:hypothetical protein [Candidatus Omnitrophota bacterium]
MAIVETGLRKWWMGVAALGSVLVAGVLMLGFGKMNDTVFGLWVGAMTANVFGYGTANLVAKKFDGSVKKGKK